MMRMAAVFLTVSLVGGAGALAQGGGPVTTLRASARAVLVDVVVTDAKGHPVQGLTAKDFAVSEDGGVQVIAHFNEERETKLLATAAGAAEKPPVNTYTNARTTPVTGTRTVLLMDALDSSVPAQAYAQDQILTYLKDAQPGTPIAIFQLDTQIHLIQGFTTDPEELRKAVKDRAMPLLSAIPQRGGYVYQQTRMDALQDGMRTIGAYLQQFPGRKNMIWFTARVPFSDRLENAGFGVAIRDRQSFSFDLSALTDVLQLGQVSVYPVDSRGLQTDPAYGASRGGLPGVNSGTRFGARQFLEHGDLEDVANATGGRAFVNTNGIKQAIAQVVEAGEDYYTILYYPTNKDWDGAYRKLKVAVDVDGVRLAYRPGYYARNTNDKRPVQAQVPGAVPLDEAQGRKQLTHHVSDTFGKVMQLGALDPGGVVFEAHVKAAPEADKVAKTAVANTANTLEPKFQGKASRLYEVDFGVAANQVQFSRGADGKVDGELEFVAVVLDDKGELVSSQESQVKINAGPETYDKLVARGMAIALKVDVPVKGKYFLRLGVHDVLSGKGGALEVAAGAVAVGVP